jgi:hypothetical protein
MALARKHKKALKKLKGSATHVVDEQREVLEHANDVLREARKQLTRYAKDDLGPTVRDTYDSRIKPRVTGSIAAGRAATNTARAHVAHDVLPAISGAIGSTLAVLSSANDPRVRDIAKKAGKRTKKLTKQAQKRVAPQKSGGVGGFILLGLGVVAAAGIAYAAWQTLRADDDLWIEDLAESDVTPEA